ncbi:hypothetical protein CLV63_105170 [Murinocardiopsis flavida]|uniref:Uncharacterized protein n=1 Tax=Murinocardiopsis flavida TaxID=645275 RepID=A0A2P8DMR0_9ACTN|nr:hypothetical protein [Murinocardiopsis flavida]PSK98496.1 hypothetical protein CLV63_105170 [Murinocardiopsis flavida]
MAEDGTTVTELRGLAERLRTRLASRTTIDADAYRLLRDDSGALRPASDAAVALWEEGGGPWRDHHLAIARHSRLYADPPQDDASDRDEHYLAYWAKVHADDSFWDRMGEHLGAVMGAPFPAEVLRAVRARLPRDLLAPHSTLAEQALADHPGVAALHLAEIRDSGLPADAIAAARKDFAGDSVTGAVIAAGEGRHNDGLDLLAPRLAADPHNPDLVRAALFVARRRMETAVIEAGWSDRSPPFLKRVVGMLTGYRNALGGGTPAAEIADELARVEFFIGLELLQRHLGGNPGSATVLNGARTAADHIDRALALNPRLASVSRIYEDVAGCLTAALLTAAHAAHKLGHGDAAARRFLDRALRHPDAVVEEAVSRQLALIVVMDMTSNTVAELDLGEAVIARLGNDPGLSADWRMSTLPMMSTLIAQRRRWAR